MVWTIRYSETAARSIRKLDPQVRRRVRAALETLSHDPLRGKPLQMDLKGLRSWRTGDYRLVYRVLEQEIEVFVVALGHRREIYERLSSLLR